MNTLEDELRRMQDGMFNELVTEYGHKQDLTDVDIEKAIGKFSVRYLQDGIPIKKLFDTFETEFGPLRPPPTPLIPLGQAERSLQTTNKDQTTTKQIS